jgi:hypothetical protein
MIWKYMRFEALTALGVMLMVVRHVMPCILVDRNQHFGRTCCLHLQGLFFYPADEGSTEPLVPVY